MKHQQNTKWSGWGANAIIQLFFFIYTAPSSDMDSKEVTFLKRDFQKESVKYGQLPDSLGTYHHGKQLCTDFSELLSSSGLAICMTN